MKAPRKKGGSLVVLRIAATVSNSVDVKRIFLFFSKPVSFFFYFSSASATSSSSKSKLFRCIRYFSLHQAISVKRETRSHTENMVSEQQCGVRLHTSIDVFLLLLLLFFLFFRFFLRCGHVEMDFLSSARYSHCDGLLQCPQGGRNKMGSCTTISEVFLRIFELVFD